MRAALLAAALLLVAAAPASAAPELVKLGDFTDPVHIASPPGDPRVFVVEQAGTIDIVGGGTFLDLESTTQTSYEQGLLSMAFSPDYATSGRFFVFLTSRPSSSVRDRAPSWRGCSNGPSARCGSPAPATRSRRPC